MKPIGIGNVVKDFMIGNTRIQICDDYCRDKTPEEVDAIIDRISEIAIRAFTKPREDVYEKE